MDEFLRREVHEEFAERMEDEHRRINHRLGKVEETIGEINRLTLSVQSLAESVQRMCKEQERQSERLQTLEGRDGEKWRRCSCTYNISDFQEEYGETGSYGTARVIGNIGISWGDNT